MRKMGNEDSFHDTGMPVPPTANLEGFLKASAGVRSIEKADLGPGDWLYVKTRNSIYRIRALENGRYEVTGGWFDRKGIAPFRTTIAGCTWGGSVLHTRLAAGCGMCLEFGNRLTTSAVQSFAVIRQRYLN